MVVKENAQFNISGICPRRYLQPQKTMKPKNRPNASGKNATKRHRRDDKESAKIIRGKSDADLACEPICELRKGRRRSGCQHFVNKMSTMHPTTAPLVNKDGRRLIRDEK